MRPVLMPVSLFYKFEDHISDLQDHLKDNGFDKDIDIIRSQIVQVLIDDYLKGLDY